MDFLTVILTVNNVRFLFTPSNNYPVIYSTHLTRCKAQQQLEF